MVVEKERNREAEDGIRYLLLIADTQKQKIEELKINKLLNKSLNQKSPIKGFLICTLMHYIIF